MIHEYKLRPYHNPENVDESKVPDGWRFRYAEEMQCLHFGSLFWAYYPYPQMMDGNGICPTITYIVPVTP